MQKYKGAFGRLFLETRFRNISAVIIFYYYTKLKFLKLKYYNKNKNAINIHFVK